jgi:hypothetical protein
MLCLRRRGRCRRRRLRLRSTSRGRRPARAGSDCRTSARGAHCLVERRLGEAEVGAQSLALAQLELTDLHLHRQATNLRSRSLPAYLVSRNTAPLSRRFRRDSRHFPAHYVSRARNENFGRYPCDYRSFQLDCVSRRLPGNFANRVERRARGVRPRVRSQPRSKSRLPVVVRVPSPPVLAVTPVPLLLARLGAAHFCRDPARGCARNHFRHTRHGRFRRIRPPRGHRRRVAVIDALFGAQSATPGGSLLASTPRVTSR